MVLQLRGHMRRLIQCETTLHDIETHTVGLAITMIEQVGVGASASPPLNHDIFFIILLQYTQALHCYLRLLAHRSPGNVPNPTPGPLMSTPLINTGQPTL